MTVTNLPLAAKLFWAAWCIGAAVILFGGAS